jgi:uncharacterized membrane protein YfcA
MGMTPEVLFPLVGFGASVLASASGVGSGTLVAPALIFAGLTPLTAVGTDLAYAAVAKTVAAGFHWSFGTVRLSTVFRLAVGSLPGGVLGSLFLPVFGSALGVDPDRWTARLLAIVLFLVTALALWPDRSEGRTADPHARELAWPAAVTIGFGVGLIVGATSVGAGAVLGAILLTWRQWDARTVVGSDLAHAAVLATATAFVRAAVGHLDLRIAVLLLAGGDSRGGSGRLGLPARSAPGPALGDGRGDRFRGVETSVTPVPLHISPALGFRGKRGRLWIHGKSRRPRRSGWSA